MIDLQGDFLSLDGYYRMGYDPSPLRKILPIVAGLIAAARSVIQGHPHAPGLPRADLADMTPYEEVAPPAIALDGTTVLLRSGPGFEIVPEINVSADDIIVDKTCNSAFTYTEDFEHVLRAQGITHPMLTGCTTDVCVHSAARSLRPQFSRLTIADACASGDQYAHEAALHMVTVENGISRRVDRLRRGAGRIREASGGKSR